MSENLIVHIIDDDGIMRESLMPLLEDTEYSVRTYASAGSFLARASSVEPGCILSDVRMPEMDGLTFCRKLREHRCHLPLVLVTAHAEVALAVAAMKAGAVDFLEMPLEAATLLKAIQAASCPRFGRRASDGNADEARRRLQVLSEREHEVLRYLAAGDSNKTAAAKLHVSPRTVEFHRARIMEKTGTHGLSDLLRLWLAAEMAAKSDVKAHETSASSNRSKTSRNTPPQFPLGRY